MLAASNLFLYPICCVPWFLDKGPVRIYSVSISLSLATNARKGFLSNQNPVLQLILLFFLSVTRMFNSKCPEEWQPGRKASEREREERTTQRTTTHPNATIPQKDVRSHFGNRTINRMGTWTGQAAKARDRQKQRDIWDQIGLSESMPLQLK